MRGTNMRLYANFTRDEYLTWLRTEEAKLLSDAYDEAQAILDDDPISEFVWRNDGPRGVVKMNGDTPVLDISDDYKFPIYVELPHWTEPLARKYAGYHDWHDDIHGYPKVHISQAVRDSEALESGSE